MKKYGVYVKISQTFGKFASLGGYFENIINVIAKNSI
jgi:hypothetical protein